MALLTESKVLRGETVSSKLSELNGEIALKYCMIQKLSTNSGVK
jgi:hypothetical protein